jgi:hypothetical protein
MKIPENLKKEFQGHTQIDWIIYDNQLSRIFCIAIWNIKNNGWVLGEYVNVVGHKTQEVMEKGYMTMLEAARFRDTYKYEIARHNINITKDVISNQYWQSLVPGLTQGTNMASPGTLIFLKDFKNEMFRLVRSKDVIWSNVR